MELLHHNIALIPLRSGSKSIPLKNIKNLLGRPLVFWVLDAAVNCAVIDRVFVATDSAEIANVVLSYHSSKIEVTGRSKASATDTAPSELVMLEFAAKHDFKNIALIQATSPLLQSKYLTAGFSRHTEDGIDSVLSVVRQRRFIWNEKQHPIITPNNYSPPRRPRRQNFNGYLVENGAFYITGRDLLLKNQCRISGNISYVEMPEDTYFEVDDYTDWEIVAALLEKRQHHEGDFSP